MGLSIETKTGVTNVSLNRQLDVTTLRQLDLLLRNLGTPAIAFDCAGITDVGRDALIGFVTECHALKARRHHVVLYNVAKGLSVQLNRLHCDSYITWYKNKKEAFKAIERG